MASVTFPTNLGGSGATISDDNDPNTGLANGGHRFRFIPALQGTIDMASYVYQYASKIDNAAADADRAENARGYVEAVADQYQVNIFEQFKQKATLISDFANQEFKLYDGLRKNDIADTALWTIERATTGTYVDATGKVRTAAIDEPRYSYDPETGGAKGLIFENLRANLLPYSEDFSAPEWSKTGVTVSDSGNESILGGVNWQTLESVSAGVVYISQLVGVSFVGTVTASIFIEKNQNSLPYIFLTGCYVTIDTDTGVATLGSGSADDISVESYPDGYRISVTKSYDGSLDLRVSYGMRDTSIGDKVNFIGAMIEEGNSPSSYIKTLGTSSVKSGDLLVKNFDGAINRKQGTLYIDYNRSSNIFDDRDIFIEFGGDSSNSLISLQYDNISSKPRIVIFAQSEGLVKSIAAYEKIAISFNNKGEYVVVTDNASYSFSHTPLDFPSISAINISSSIGLYKIKNILYIPYALTTSELETLTTV